MLLGMQTFHVLKTVQKCKRSLRTKKSLKNDGHFQTPHPQISLKQLSDICENVVYFFYYAGGGKMINDFCKTKKNLKNKWSVHFLDILQLPHTVISNSEQLTHPNGHC